MRFSIILLIFTFNLFSTAWASSSYIKLEGVGGLGTNDKMDAYQTVTKGVGYNLSYGMRSRITGLEFSYTSASLSGDINHGGNDRVAVQDFFIFSADIFFYVTPKFSVKFGYGLVTFDDYLEGVSDPNIFNGAANTYGLRSGSTIGGIRYGVHYDFFRIGRTINLHTSYTYQDNGIGHEHLITLGIKFNLRGGLMDRLVR